MRRSRREEPYKQPARRIDEPVSQIEIQAILERADGAWHGAREGARDGKAILVLHYAAADAAGYAAVSSGRILAGWVVDVAGARSVTADEAERVRDGIVSNGIGFNPAVIAFAPVNGTNHLVLGHFFGPRMDYGGMVEISRRSGIRTVRSLWLS